MKAREESLTREHLHVRVHGAELLRESDLAPEELRELLGTPNVGDRAVPGKAPSYAQIVMVTPEQAHDLGRASTHEERDTAISTLLGWYTDAIRDEIREHAPPFVLVLHPNVHTYYVAEAEAAAGVLRERLAGLPGVKLFCPNELGKLPPRSMLRHIIVNQWWTPYAATGSPFRG